MNKKNSNKPLVPGEVKKGFRFYAMLVLAITMMTALGVTAFAADGDPLDVLVLCSETLQPLSLVDCYPIGMIMMMDNGAGDEKIICIPFNDPTYNVYTDITELPRHIFEEMKHFFTVYKALENKDTVIDDVKGPDEARATIESCIDRYIEKYCK